MKITPEITYRGVEKTQAIDNLVNEKIAKLERYCDYINSCRIAVEKAHDHPQSGSPYRVRIDITVPPHHELAVVENPAEGNQYEPLESVIRNAFEAASRQLIELKERQNNQVKVHPQQNAVAVITKLFPDQDYGFIRTLDTGKEIYFHRHSVANNNFDKLEIGTGVQFTETLGQMGPQATTIRLVDKPGENVAKSEDTEVDLPLGWKPS